MELSRIVGSAGKYDWFDEGFMSLRAVSRERWKRIDRGVYFVKDGHHRVRVARFHGAEWIDAEITEFRSPVDHPPAYELRAGPSTAL
ncbi:MAG TPA: hypothetical protein VF068_12360 [Rubrobacter sp.]